MNLITENAGIDKYSDQDYLDMLAELMQTYTLRELKEALNSTYSHTHWGSMAKGEREISRKAKNELRAALKLPLLPPTIEEAMSVVDENAKVYRTGQETPDLVYMANRAEALAGLHADAVAGATKASNERRNEEVNRMSMALLGWKIANRESYEVPPMNDADMQWAIEKAQEYYGVAPVTKE